mgnify:CR=1 FL=1
MRYAIGCTYTDPITKKISSPYLVTYDENYMRCELTLNKYSYLKGKQIVCIYDKCICQSIINMVKIQMNKYSNYKYYLLKVDSLNFPYKGFVHVSPSKVSYDTIIALTLSILQFSSTA